MHPFLTPTIAADRAREAEARAARFRLRSAGSRAGLAATWRRRGDARRAGSLGYLAR